MGLKRARSFTLLWPFLWSVQTLKEPCISSLPKSFRLPWKVKIWNIARVVNKFLYLYAVVFSCSCCMEVQWQHGIHVNRMESAETSKPVMAIWCMESLTDLMMSSIVAKASSSSAVPSEFLLHFCISCKMHKEYIEGLVLFCSVYFDLNTLNNIIYYSQVLGSGKVKSDLN